MCCSGLVFFFFKQKTAYEMRISDWSSDVCSSDLIGPAHLPHEVGKRSIGHACGRRIGGRLKTIVLTDRDEARSAPHVRFCGADKANEPSNLDRSEERSVGQECVSTCRYRWSPYH